MVNKPTYEELEQRIIELDKEVSDSEMKQNLIITQRDLSIALNTANNIENGLNLCLKAALKVSGMDCGGIYLFDEKSKALNLACHAGLPSDMVKKCSHYDLDSDNTKLVIAGEPLYTTHQQLDVPLSKIERQQNLYAFALVPIIHYNQVVGCMNVSSHSLEEVPFTSRYALESIAAQIGSEIHRLQTEKALKESEWLLKKAQELSHFGSYSRNIKTNNIKWSDELYHIFGYEPGEISPTFDFVLDHVHPEDKKQFLKKNEALVAGFGSYHNEYRIIRKDGGERCVLSTANLDYDKKGVPIHQIGTLQDITEKKDLENKLTQAQKMEAIGTLASGIAHDFNNILSPIVGYAEMSLMKVEEGSMLHHNINEILLAGKRAAELVNQILTFSRKKKKDLKPVMVKLMVKEVMKLLRASLPSTIEIKQNIESDAMIMGDPIQIHQVLINLCTNAGQAMQKNGGVLEVTLKQKMLDANTITQFHYLKPGVYLKLSIRDTGHGIPKDALGSIFNPYYTTKKQDEGTGIGLSIVHGIVKILRGEITVQSIIDKGTTFNVYLPVIEKEKIDKTNLIEIMATGNEKILFVDDEHQITKMAKLLIENLGYEVTPSTSSIEAIELFSVNPSQYDLLITDMTMPKMTGVQLCNKIHEIKPDFPVILCTGFSDQINEEKIKKHGIRGIIKKPMEINVIANTIRSVLDKTI